MVSHSVCELEMCDAAATPHMPLARQITYDSKTLSITGVRVPNEHEEAKLQHKCAALCYCKTLPLHAKLLEYQQKYVQGFAL
eukprot:433050-Amphidinium_carterae.2